MLTIFWLKQMDSFGVRSELTTYDLRSDSIAAVHEHSSRHPQERLDLLCRPSAKPQGAWGQYSRTIGLRWPLVTAKQIQPLPFHQSIWPKQFVCLKSKSACNSLDIVQRYVSSLALYVGNEGAMKASLKSQGLLRPAALSP